MARPYQVQGHQPVQFQAPAPIQLPQMPMVQALRTPDQQQEQGGMPKGMNTAIRKGIEKLMADGSLTQAEATQILTSDAAYTGGGIPGMTPAEATRVLTSDAAYSGSGAQAFPVSSSPPIQGAPLGGQIGGSSVTGGTSGAGLGGPGAPGYVGAPALSSAGSGTAVATTGPAMGVSSGTAGGAGLSGAGLAAAQTGVLALPFVANALDEGNRKNFIEAQRRIDAGDFEEVGGLKMTQGKGGTYLSGSPDMLNRARTAAERRGIKTFNVGNNLVSFAANPDNTKTALSGFNAVRPDPTVFSDYRSPQRRSYGTSNPMTTALRGR